MGYDFLLFRRLGALLSLAGMIALLLFPAGAGAQSPSDSSGADQYAPSLPSSGGSTFPDARSRHGSPRQGAASPQSSLPKSVREALAGRHDAAAAALAKLAQDPSLGAPVDSASAGAGASGAGARGAGRSGTKGAAPGALPAGSTPPHTTVAASLGDALGAGTLIPLGVVGLGLLVLGAVVFARRRGSRHST